METHVIVVDTVADKTIRPSFLIHPNIDYIQEKIHYLYAHHMRQIQLVGNIPQFSLWDHRNIAQRVVSPNKMQYFVSLI